MSQPAVSKHLGVLKQAGLVRDRPAGRLTHYSAQAGRAWLRSLDWTRPDGRFLGEPARRPRRLAEKDGPMNAERRRNAYPCLSSENIPWPTAKVWRALTATASDRGMADEERFSSRLWAIAFRIARRLGAPSIVKFQKSSRNASWLTPGKLSRWRRSSRGP